MRAQFVVSLHYNNNWSTGLNWELLSKIQEDNILFVVDIIDAISKNSRFNKFIEDPLIEAKKT